MSKRREQEGSANPTGGTTLNLRDRVRALIEAEVARADPIEAARRSLALIVETSVRVRESNGEIEVTVVGHTGQARTRLQGERSIPLTIADYVEELRHEHPALFKSHKETVAAAQPAAEKSRDWLDLSSEQPADPMPTDEHSRASSLKVRLSSAAQAFAAAGSLATGSIGRLGGSFRARRVQRAAAIPVPASVGTARSRLRPALGVAISLAALSAGSALVILRLTRPAELPAQQAAAQLSAPITAPGDPAATGTLPSLPASGATDSGLLRGLPEVLDTSTLRLHDRIVHLFGVEWARGGGDPDDLVKYLRGREVSCTPAGPTDAYRCHVDGQDLSRVVLFNGGGRITSDATPELRAAEDHARDAKLGVWRENRASAP